MVNFQKKLFFLNNILFKKTACGHIILQNFIDAFAISILHLMQSLREN